MRLLVISSVVHFRHGGRLYAYGAYAREIEIWADLFDELEIAGACREGVPPGDSLPLNRPNITITPQKEAGGNTWLAKLGLLFALPGIIYSLCRAMRRADAVHVRCPGNLGLLGAVLAPLFTGKITAKYAGQWVDFPGEELTVRLQRAILRSRWWRGPVTVYGAWPGQPAHVVPFFTSMLSEDQIARARARVSMPERSRPMQVLYVGRLSTAKNVDVLLHAVAAARKEGIALRAVIVGEGPERGRLETTCAELGITGHVEFTGGVSQERVFDYFEQSDILALVSESEGWPKAIAEAMAFGLICIGSNRGLVPQMLGEGRGLVAPPRDVEALAGALLEIARRPEEYQEMRRRAAAWAQQYSLEGLREAVRSLHSERWGVKLEIATAAVTKS
jgi:hypothetical protein